MIVWTDIESTGLNPVEGHLLEVALVVTDDQLNEVSYFNTLVAPVGVDIDQVPMDQVVKEMHEKNGLFADLRAGGGARRHTAEEYLIHHIIGVNGKLAGNVELDVCVNCKKKRAEHHDIPGSDIACCPAPDPTMTQKMTKFESKIVTLASQTPLAGSTVGFDRRWLKEHMPKLEALFSYRSVDVSSIVELARRWAPAIYEGRPKAEAGAAHRALADVRESIAYLKYFRQCGFIGGVGA